MSRLGLSKAKGEWNSGGRIISKYIGWANSYIWCFLSYLITKYFNAPFDILLLWKQKNCNENNVYSFNNSLIKCNKLKSYFTVCIAIKSSYFSLQLNNNSPRAWYCNFKYPMQNAAINSNSILKMSWNKKMTKYVGL